MQTSLLINTRQSKEPRVRSSVYLLIYKKSSFVESFVSVYQKSRLNFWESFGVWSKSECPVGLINRRGTYRCSSVSFRGLNSNASVRLQTIHTATGGAALININTSQIQLYPAQLHNTSEGKTVRLWVKNTITKMQLINFNPLVVVSFHYVWFYNCRYICWPNTSYLFLSAFH